MAAGACGRGAARVASRCGGKRASRTAFEPACVRGLLPGPAWSPHRSLNRLLAAALPERGAECGRFAVYLDRQLTRVRAGWKAARVDRRRREGRGVAGELGYQ